MASELTYLAASFMQLHVNWTYTMVEQQLCRTRMGPTLAHLFLPDVQASLCCDMLFGCNSYVSTTNLCDQCSVRRLEA